MVNLNAATRLEIEGRAENKVESDCKLSYLLVLDQIYMLRDG
jgi:hypothetical protein